MAIDTILLKTSSRCNIACTYCYVYNLGDNGWKSQPKVMSTGVVESVIDNLGDLFRSQDRGFSVVLHGGEPLLIGPKKLARLLYGLRSVLPQALCPLSIQSNGMLIDDALLDLCSKTQTTIAVSIDGPSEVHNRHRLDFSNRGTFEKTVSGIRRLQNHWDSEFLFSGTLSVIDPSSNPAQVYGFFKDLGTPSMDFLLRDGNHSCLPAAKASFDSKEYGDWLIKLFDLYIEDPSPVPIRIIDDIVKLILGGVGSKEGIGSELFSILIIDTDGSVSKNDTLKSSFDGADRFDETWSIQKHRLHEIAQTGSFKKYLRLQRPSSQVCQRCPELRVCGGGMPLYRWSDEKGYDNPSVYCTDHKALIGHIRSRLREKLPCPA